MANTNDPFGALPIKTEGKESRVTYFPKASGAAIAPGDFVIANSSGLVTIATNSGALLGVAAEYKASSDTSDIAVYADPEQVFEIQADGDLQQTDVFMNAAITATALDATLKQSKQSLAIPTSSTATVQLKVLGLSEKPLAAWGSYARVRCKINNHLLKGGTGTGGV